MKIIVLLVNNHFHDNDEVFRWEDSVINHDSLELCLAEKHMPENIDFVIDSGISVEYEDGESWLDQFFF